MREMMLPLLGDFETVLEIPHTISFFIRKMKQIVSFDELPKDKRPPEAIWDNTIELENWFDNVFNRTDNKDSTPEGTTIIVTDDDIEG